MGQYAYGKFSLYDLKPDGVYEVIRDFVDHYGGEFETGTRLMFVTRHFLPYEGGHTLVFKERTIYIKDDNEVYNQFDEYFAQIG